jgi:hypothetical protein
MPIPRTPTIAQAIVNGTELSAVDTKKIMAAIIVGNLLASNKKRDPEWCVCAAVKAVNLIEERIKNE